MHNRLMNRPRLAASILLPPSGRRWIAVESASHKNVVELCINLSTIHHPLEIELVPVEDRLAWLNWQQTKLNLPAWVRVKRRSILKGLKADKKLIKYAGDLAWVKREYENSKATICLVPRLQVTIERDGKKRRRKRLPRLLHPKAIGEPEETVDVSRPIDPNVWWCPEGSHELESVEHGIYRLAKEKNPDDLCLPFAIFEVSVELLEAEAAPSLNEMRVFTEGMAVGSDELGFKAPSRDFVRWTYDSYIAAPLEPGHKVELLLGGQEMVRGVVEDIIFEQVDVRVDGTREIISAKAMSVRRLYEVGDAVRVIKSTNQDREGWVLDIKEDVVDVFDRHTKDAVCTPYVGTTGSNTETVSREMLATPPLRRV